MQGDGPVQKGLTSSEIKVSSLPGQAPAQAE